MSKNKFTISFKSTKKDLKLLEIIQEIEEKERSQVIKDILYKKLVIEGKRENVEEKI